MRPSTEGVLARYNVTKLWENQVRVSFCARVECVPGVILLRGSDFLRSGRL